MYIVPHMKVYMRSLYKWLKDWLNKSALRKAPTYVRTDPEEWHKCLLTYDSRPLILSPRSEEVGWVGDASSSFGIGILIGRNWACFELSQGWQTLHLLGGKRFRVWAETVTIHLGLLVVTKLRRVASE